MALTRSVGGIAALDPISRTSGPTGVMGTASTGGMTRAQADANAAKYMNNNAGLTVRQTDPGGLLSRLNPNDLMALRLMSRASDKMGAFSQFTNNLTSQGFSPLQINSLINMGMGANGQQALAGDWQQQLSQKYGNNWLPSDVMGGTNYASVFQPQKNIVQSIQQSMGQTQPQQPSVGQPQTPSQPQAKTGAALPTNGVWDVNTFYGPGGTQPTPVQNPTGTNFTPTNNFSPIYGQMHNGASATPALTQQSNMRSGGLPMTNGRTITPMGGPAPTPTAPAPTTRQGGSYSFIAPGWSSMARRAR